MMVGEKEQGEFFLLADYSPRLSGREVVKYPSTTTNSHLFNSVRVTFHVGVAVGETRYVSPPLIKQGRHPFGATGEVI